MKVEVKVPEVGESVQEALLAQWLRKDGETVQKDELLFVIETDKVTLEVSAPADGVLKIEVEEGETVSVGTVVAVIDTEAAEKAAPKPEAGAQAAAPAAARPPEHPKPPPPTPPEGAPRPPMAPEKQAAEAKPLVSQSAQALAQRMGVELSEVAATGPGGRITEGDVLLFLEQAGKIPPAPPLEKGGAKLPPEKGRAAPKEREEGIPKREEPGRTVRKPMSPIRQRIAERLLEARRNTAMLTTFNEIDMGRVKEIRARLGEEFQKKHGVRLGIMSFFLKASAAALKEMPEVNAFIDGKDIVYQNFYHIGVAIGAQRGLIVPVIRDVDRLSFAELERAIVDFVDRISQNRLELSALEGGTFTITNGGVFGSLLSTPILNPPQSAILGMHKVQERPLAIGGQVVIRPMMYVALSYDHRIIDGREAVLFLRRIKDYVENPERLLMEI